MIYFIIYSLYIVKVSMISVILILVSKLGAIISFNI